MFSYILNINFNVQKATVADTSTLPLLDDGNEVKIDTQGFGLYADDTGVHFGQQTKLPSLNRKKSLTGTKSYVDRTFNFFTRRRPQYFDVKAYGAKSDGVTDDTAAINSILVFAANISAIFHTPYGVYVIKDTAHVPLGSRIVDQAWQQIIASGSKFEGMENPILLFKLARRVIRE